MTDHELLDQYAQKLLLTGAPLSGTEIEQVLKPLDHQEKTMPVLVREAGKPLYNPIRMYQGEWTEEKAVGYLCDRGFTPGAGWIWVSNQKPNERDWSAMGFLALREWTYKPRA